MHFNEEKHVYLIHSKSQFFHSLKITKRYLSMTIMLLLTLKGWSGDFISKEWALTILLINS